ncbi:Hemerythrin HHE cation binding domain protein [Kribbella flavida DSM 17836]|uniref:Hemerythrin HHE cation binding domain protein n=1 Tax=Kribbella flavida (strain DSM 17836 / JCM 10339 / NBRC 14399) TaxID=479435 RepID=D2PP47_KRIFD|nr:hemerythrin domain-containing protein [Kribbella flavida]ADB34643.1 Hemerythrin HHE cation binding domain protein [Kribbella flavida DSM 17836]
MSRLEAFGNQLIEFHLSVRDQLDELRETGSSSGAELRVHCLAFCRALTAHHTGEDNGAFVALAEHYPELRPVLEELAGDHVIIEDALRRLEKLDELAPAERLRELDTLSALLETHFNYEERKLVAAMNTLTDDRLGLPFQPPA